MGDLRFEALDQFAQGGLQRVIACAGEHIRSGRDEMGLEPECGTHLAPTFDHDLRLVDLQIPMETLELLANERDERLR